MWRDAELYKPELWVPVLVYGVRCVPGNREVGLDKLDAESPYHVKYWRSFDVVEYWAYPEEVIPPDELEHLEACEDALKDIRSEQRFGVK